MRWELLWRLYKNFSLFIKHFFKLIKYSFTFRCITGISFGLRVISIYSFLELWYIYIYWIHLQALRIISVAYQSTSWVFGSSSWLYDHLVDFGREVIYWYLYPKVWFCLHLKIQESLLQLCCPWEFEYQNCHPKQLMK